MRESMLLHGLSGLLVSASPHIDIPCSGSVKTCVTRTLWPVCRLRDGERRCRHAKKFRHAPVRGPRHGVPQTDEDATRGRARHGDGRRSGPSKTPWMATTNSSSTSEGCGSWTRMACGSFFEPFVKREDVGPRFGVVPGTGIVERLFDLTTRDRWLPFPRLRDRPATPRPNGVFAGVVVAVLGRQGMACSAPRARVCS
jgi:hypothetical protein